MATEKETAPQVILTGDQYARQQLAREMEELSKAPLDKTVPGGRYQGTDGKLHDADGQPLEDESEPESFSFASDEAEKLATEKGLTEADFEGVKASGAGGYTKADVQKVADAKAG